MKIALMGYARSGKDEIYEMIKSKTEAGVYRLAFGDALRGYSHEIFDTPKEPKPRWLYEKFGKGMRDIDKDVWVKQVDKYYRHCKDFRCKNFVVTDLRQPNEWKWCKENGFTIIYIECDESIRRERSKNDTNWMPINPSESEIGNLGYDFRIKNNGSLEDLELKINELLKRRDI